MKKHVIPGNPFPLPLTIREGFALSFELRGGNNTFFCKTGGRVAYLLLLLVLPLFFTRRGKGLGCKKAESSGKEVSVYG
ncbi:MAG: hypothetical protein A3G93_05685 [Nitrospinae bacterium RIFCSPLOWO2_12_FULL_45_22]|nr:MAG: hypothetical protein A3G93_05685 [Nitrospinae bacterium RIFCSPLOWO2_12_FULL_45_22]